MYQPQNILRAFKEPLAKKRFSFSILLPICNFMLSTSFLSLNAFLRILSFLLQLKLILEKFTFLLIWISFCIYFFSQFLQIFISSSRLYHLLVFIAKLWDDNLILVMVFLLLKLFKFSFLLAEFFCLWKKFFFSFL